MSLPPPAHAAPLRGGTGYVMLASKAVGSPARGSVGRVFSQLRTQDRTFLESAANDYNARASSLQGLTCNRMSPSA